MPTDVRLHNLEIRSLRDSHATCSCGDWELSSPAFDRETDRQLRDRIREAHEQHRRDVNAKEADQPTPGEWIVISGSIYAEDEKTRLLKADRDEPNTMPTERDANIHLAARAPKLRRALERLIAWHDQGHTSKTAQAMGDRFYSIYLRDGATGLDKVLWDEARESVKC